MVPSERNGSLAPQPLGLSLPHAPVLSARSGPVGQLAVSGTTLDIADGTRETLYDIGLVMLTTVDHLKQRR